MIASRRATERGNRLSPPILRQWSLPAQLAMAAVALLAATGVRWLLDPFLLDRVPYATYFVAVAVVAWVASAPVAIATSVLGWLIADYAFVPPRGTFSWQDPDAAKLVGALAYFSVAATIVLVAHGMRAAQRSEAETTERLRTTLSSIGDAVIATDRHGDITMMNTVAEGLTGWKASEAVGKTLTDVFRIVNEETREPVANPAERALRDGVVVGLANHTLLLARDGSEHPIDDSAAPIRCAMGQIVGCVLTFRDVEQRRRHERELREGAALVASAVGSITDGFFKLDREWRFVFVNDAAVERFGKSREELIGRNLWEEFPDALGNEAYVQLTRAMQERTTVAYEVFDEKRQRWFYGRGYPTDDGGLSVYSQDVTERKESEAARRRSEAQLELVSNNVPALISYVGADGRYRGCNDLYMKWFGLAREQVVGHHMRDVLGESAWEAVRPYFARALAGETAEFEAEAKYRRGGTRWIHGVYTPDRSGAGGAVAGVFVMVNDVSQRKQDDQTRARLAAIVDSSDDAIISKDLNGIIQSWNDGAERLFGYTAAEALGKPVSMLIPEERLEEETEILAQIRRGEPVRPYETVRRRKDGSLVDISLAVSPVVNEAGTVIGASKIARNITERVRTEHELRKATAKFASVFNQSGIFAGIMDLNGTLREVNDLAVEWCGYTRAEVLDKPFWQTPWWRGSEEMQQRIRAATEQTLAGNTYREQLRFWLADGTERVVDFAMHPIRDEAGRVIFLHPTGIDVTERKRAEEDRNQLLDAERAARSELEKLSRIKDEFLATVSHELRSPLNGILGWAQLLKRAPEDESLRLEGIEAVLSNGRMQAQIIDDLLDMNRIMSGKLRLDVQDVEVSRIVEEALATVRPSAEAKQIRIERMLDQHAGPVKGDPMRLQQVVWNLLGNAIKFTPKGGRVRVVTERVNSHVEISVTDTGIGIQREFLPYVFERFRQSDSSSTRVHGGLGLGLAIAKQIVDLHGGSLLAASEGEGKGATFRIRLPIAVARGPINADLRAMPELAASDRTLSGVRILVVDDDPGACEVLERLLVSCEAAVDTVTSGQAALDRIAAFQPDVLLCDVGMPGMDGFEVIHRIRTEGANFPAIAVTAFARTEDRIRALQAGFDMHLSKPVDARELVAALQTVLR